MSIRLLTFSVLAILLLKYQSLKGQDNATLSRNFMNTNLTDSSRLKAIDDLTWNYLFTNTDSAIITANLELSLAKHFGNKEFQAFALNHLGTAHYYKSKFPLALSFYFRGLKLMNEINNQNGKATLLGNIGNFYTATGDNINALKYLMLCLQILKNGNDVKKTGSCKANIAMILYNLNNYKKSELWFKEAVSHFKEINFKEGLCACYNNLGTLYMEVSELDLAISNFEKSMFLSQELNYIQAIAQTKMNLGLIFERKKYIRKALNYFEDAISIMKQIGDLGSLKIALLRQSELYEKLNQHNKALVSYKDFILIRDSVFNADNIKKQTELEMGFEFEKKEAIARAEQEKKDALSNQEKTKQKIVLFAVAFGLLSVIIFSLILFKRFKVTKKQKAIIEVQKSVVDDAYHKLHEKNKEITDSIRYAARIQRSLITNDKYIAKFLNRKNNHQSKF